MLMSVKMAVNLKNRYFWMLNCYLTRIINHHHEAGANKMLTASRKEETEMSEIHITPLRAHNGRTKLELLFKYGFGRDSKY